MSVLARRPDTPTPQLRFDASESSAPPRAAGFGVDWSIDERVAWCRRFRSLIAARASDLAEAVSSETGRSRWDAMTGDVYPLLATCKWHARRARDVLREKQLGHVLLWLPGVSAVVTRAPIGRVGIIATWNYPVQLLGIQLVQALVVGNRVTVKPSERAPRSSGLLLDLADEAGLPEGTLARYPATREAGAAMLEHENLDHVVFTGSTRVGRRIAEWAAERGVTTTLEMTGSDSAIVLDDASARLAAQAIWSAVRMNAGQTCMAPRRVLVASSVYDEFLRELAPLVAGCPALPLIDESAADESHRLATDALRMGGRSLSGVVEPPFRREGRPFSYWRPIVIADCPPEADAFAGEHFGPLLAVRRVDTTDEAIDLHRSAAQTLATAVFTKRRRRARRLATRLGSSVVTINDCVRPVGAPWVSLGGAGSSGWGVSRGAAGLLEMTRPVTVTCTNTWLRAPTEEPSERVQRVLNRIVTGRGPRRTP